MDKKICKYLENDSIGLGRCNFELPMLPEWVTTILNLPLIRHIDRRKNPNCENCWCFVRVKK